MQNESYRQLYRRNPELGATERMLPAIILIAVGGIFLLANLHIIYVREWLRFWPVIVVAIGLVKLVDSPDSGGRVGGGILVGIGAVLMARSLGFIEVRLWDLWPLILIAIGIGMLFGKAHFIAEIRNTSNANQMRESAVFSGGKRTITTQEFQGGKVEAVFGGYEIDLRQADIAGNSTELELNAVFGGVELRVPQSWNIVSRGTGVFGAFVDNTVHPDPRVFPAIKQLIIKGGAVFGGVDIKN